MKAVYIDSSGARHVLDVRAGDTLMRAAVRAGLDGILGECGGGLTCATCHVRVADPWAERLAPVSPAEQDMLAFTAEPADATSRLCCQIRMAADLDGIELHLPASQL